MRSLRAVLALAVAGSLCASCHASSGPAARPESSRGARAGISATLVLPARVMTAGSAIDGRVVIDNATGRPVPAWGCLTLFQVLLVGSGYRPTPTWLHCLQRFVIPPGESSYPVTIAASYRQCGPGGLVPCLADGRPPPLPPGSYRAVLFQLRHLATAPPPVRVTVLAPAAGP